jgi:hypothetical protein
MKAAFCVSHNSAYGIIQLILYNGKTKMPQPRIRKSRAGVEITAYKSGHTERLLAVMTPQTAADLARILEATREGDKPQSFGDWLAQHIAADAKRLDIPVTL